MSIKTLTNKHFIFPVYDVSVEGEGHPTAGVTEHGFQVIGVL